MKTIAVPLLLASSARAEAKKDIKAGMRQDWAEPMPMLIADAWTDGDCADAAGAVVAANALVGTAQGEFDALVAERDTATTGPAALVGIALAARVAATVAVNAKDVLMATLVLNDDTAQALLLTKQQEKNAKTYAWNLATSAKAAADAALQAATDAKVDGAAILALMATAKQGAADHAAKEEEQKIALLVDPEVGNVPATLTLKNDADTQAVADELVFVNQTKLAVTNKQAEADALLPAKENVMAVASQINALVINIGLEQNPAQSAKAKGLFDIENAKNAATGGGTPNQFDAYVTASDDWVIKGKLTTKAMKAYNDADIWTDEIHATSGCTGDLSAADVISEADCKLLCGGKAAWTLTAGVPSNASQLAGGSAAGATSAVTICYGYEWKASGTECKLSTGTAYPGVGGGSGLKCVKRTKSTFAAPVFAAVEVTKDGAAKWVEVVAKGDLWKTQQLVVLDKQKDLDVLAKYKVKVDELEAASGIARPAAEGAWDIPNNLIAGLVAAYDAKVVSHGLKTATAAATAARFLAWTTAQEVNDLEIVAQTAIGLLVDAEHAAQDNIQNGLIQAELDANADSHVGLLSTALLDKSNASDAFDAQEGNVLATRAALATPEAELGPLRVTATEATASLVGAIGDLAAAQDLIDAKEDELDGLSVLYLAAIVACQSEKFDLYAATLAAALATRAQKLEDIERLVDEAAAAAPAAGAAGARCEKAMSNGTFRPKRSETTCGEGLCCGAARIPQGNVMLTVETCQLIATTEYTWAEPRAPLQTSFPVGSAFPFTCIEGAQKLAAAASALATAVYMLA